MLTSLVIIFYYYFVIKWKRFQKYEKTCFFYSSCDYCFFFLYLITHTHTHTFLEWTFLRVCTLYIQWLQNVFAHSPISQ